MGLSVSFFLREDLIKEKELERKRGENILWMERLEAIFSETLLIQRFKFRAFGDEA